MRRFSVAAAVLFLSLCADVFGQYYENKFDVPYVPTADAVVEEMLRMAHVTEQDILYDLGCGDGRIVISAARDIGTHGVGIDIDPKRIDECHENAEKEGVTDRVRFLNQDLFAADISVATVVCLYLLPSINLKLRPKLFSDLKPGTRIVSHDFNMGGWDEDDFNVVEGFYSDFESYSDHASIYFWTIPANVSGDWSWSDGDDESLAFKLHIEQIFQKIGGHISNGDSGLAVRNVSISGDRLTFETVDSENGTQLYIGIVDRNVVNGTVITKTGDLFVTEEWRAKRDPSTMVRIDVDE